jgi:hypothetical protein
MASQWHGAGPKWNGIEPKDWPEFRRQFKAYLQIRKCSYIIDELKGKTVKPTTDTHGEHFETRIQDDNATVGQGALHEHSLDWSDECSNVWQWYESFGPRAHQVQRETLQRQRFGLAAYRTLVASKMNSVVAAMKTVLLWAGSCRHCLEVHAVCTACVSFSCGNADVQPVPLNQ